MRSSVYLREDKILRAGAALCGALFLAASALAADLAREHMSAIGTFCGAPATSPHCGWCLGAASLALAGLATFAAAFRQPGTYRLATDQGQA